jgi:hypothetical protein
MPGYYRYYGQPCYYRYDSVVAAPAMMSAQPVLLLGIWLHSSVLEGKKPIVSLPELLVDDF